MFGMKREKSFVGLDIGSHAIKALELESRRKGKKEVYRVAKIGYEPLPHDAIVEGTIIDSTAVVETIKTLFEKNKIINKDIVISISGNSVIIKKISLPHMETEELAESIIWEAKHNIPYPYEETHIDYAILKPSSNGENQNLDILLVAVKKEKIAAYSNIVLQARKNLEAVEVDAFALFNALEINYPDEFREKTTALINMGAGITTIVICERGVPQLFRDLSLGGAFIIENIRKDLNIGIAEAEVLIRGNPVKDIPAYEFEAVLDMNIKSLLEEIEKTFTFFEAEDKTRKKIELILLSGGLATLRKVSGAFHVKFGVPADIFNPFRTVNINSRISRPAYDETMAPFFAVATGLATRREEK